MTTLKRDLSDLPAPSEPEGLAPDADPVYVRMLLDEIRKGGTWGLSFDYHTDKPQVSDTLSRHSAANSCLKRVALQRDGVDEDPMDDAGLWVTFLGTMIHDAFQRAMTQQYPHALFEVGTTLENLTSGSCDALVDFGPDGHSVPIRLEAVRREDRDERHDGRVLDLAGSEAGERLPGVLHERGDEEPGGAPSERVRLSRGGDPSGDDDRPSVQEASVRQPGPPGGGDAPRERGGEVGVGVGSQRGQDALPDGSPVQSGEHEGEAPQARTAEDVRDVRSGAQAGSAPAPKDPGVVREVLEVKSTGGFSHKMAVGERGAAQGPKSAHMVQLALNVVGHDADKGTLVYLATEAISKKSAERKNIDETTRFGAQWTFTREQLQPLADQWLERLAWVRDHDTDETPRFWPEETPLGARIVDPNTSRWELRDGDDIVDTGSVWSGSGCLYCPTRTACIKAWADGR